MVLELLPLQRYQGHHSLIEADPDIGYKDDAWMCDLFQKHNLEIVKIVNMPANNLAFVIERNHLNRSE